MNLNGESTLTRLSGLMTSVVLCTTGLPPGEREEICNMARVMGAAVNDNLSRVTTHLVCVTVKGAKYDATMHPPLRGQVYLVTPEYIRRCHTTIARLDESKYPTLALSGLRISISGFESASREVLREAIVATGGAYTPTLNAGTTDVLVARRAAGAKYHAAAAWNIPCVSRGWLDDSLLYGHRLDMHKYTLSDAKLMGKRKRELGLEIENNIVELVRAAHDTSDSKAFDSVIAFVADCSVPDTVRSDIDVLLSRGQGTRLPVLAAAVTHVIVPPSFDPTSYQMKRWSQHTNSAHVVQASWIAASAISGSRQPEVLFAASDHD